MNSAASLPLLARDWFCALRPEARAEVLAVREDPAFVAMFLQMYAVEMHNISAGAHALFAKEYLAKCYMEAKVHTRRRDRVAVKPTVPDGAENEASTGHERPPAEPENDQFALAANLFCHVVVGIAARGCEYLSLSEAVVAHPPTELLALLDMLCGGRFLSKPPLPNDIRTAMNSRTFLECNWLSIRYPQPLHVVLVSRLQLAFWTHFYESTQALSLHRAPLSIGQTDIAKLCAFWESLSPPQRDAILEGNSPALALQAESPEQTKLLIRRMVRCPLQWVCHDCGAAASASVARLLERYADSIAEELGTDDTGSAVVTTATTVRASHKPKRRKKNRSRQNGKAPHNGALDANGSPAPNDDDEAPEDGTQETGTVLPAAAAATITSPTTVCEVGPASPRDVSHEVDTFSTTTLQQTLSQVASLSPDDDDPEERRRQRELAAKAMEDERIARLLYIRQIQTEDDNERRRQAQIADNAAEEERRRRIEEIAEAARQSERERQEAQRRVRLATEQERARQLLQLELHRDMEQKERRRRQNWAAKQLNEQQVRARIQHEHNMRRVQDMLSKNVVVFTKRMELFRSLHRNVCEAIRASLEDLVNTIWPGSKVMVFGSCAMGLTLPSSDIDFVIQLPEGAQVPGHPPRQADHSSVLSGFDVTAAIHTLASCLMTVPWLSSLCPIDTAAVPVIKCTASALALNIPASQGTSLSFFADIRHIPVDITFDTGSHSGLPTCEYVRRVLAETEYELLELVLVVKELLAQYGLNTPYSGGLSSYAVILLAKACIDIWRRMPPPPRLRGRTSSTATDSTGIERAISEELNGEVTDPPALERPSVGQLFVMFLRLYGRDFDPLTTGVDVTREDSPLFTIRQAQEAFHVLVIDPLDPARNVAKASFAFRQVQWVFSQCLATLETAGCALCHRHPNAEVLKLLIRY